MSLRGASQRLIALFAKTNGSRSWKMRFGMIAFCRFSKVAVPTSAKNGRGVREQLKIVFSLGFLCIQRVKKHRFLVYPALVSGLRDRQLFSQNTLNFKKPILFTIMDHDKNIQNLTRNIKSS